MINRRELMTGAAALGAYGALCGDAEAQTARKLLLPLSGGVRPSIQAFSPLKAKLNAGNNVVIFVNGDSTAYNQPYGPYILLGTLLAQQISGTFTYYLWGEWNVSAPTGPKAYNSAVTTSYGSGPTITMYLAACPGQVAGYLWDSTRKAAALDGIPTPDVAILHQGHNQGSFSTQATNPLTTSNGLFLAAIGMTALEWPNVPQIITTQNPDLGDSGMVPVYNSMLAVGQQQANLTVVNTYAPFIAQGQPAILYRLGTPPIIHPSDGTDTGRYAGALLEANTLLAAFNNSIPTASFQTAGWTNSNKKTNILTNGTFSNWTGAFPLRCDANGSAATVSKDSTTVYNSAPYSMSIAPNGSSNAMARYAMSSAEYNQMAGNTVSAAILYYQDVAETTRPYFIFQTNGGVAYYQGDLIFAWGNWYLAVWSNVYVASVDANAHFGFYPSFGTTPTSNNGLRIQEVTLVLGPTPSGGVYF